MRVFDPKKHAFVDKGKAVEEKKASPKQQEKDKEAAGQPLDEALEDTFPASDPPAATVPKKREGATRLP